MPPFCEKCGADNAGKYCGECGRPQDGNPARPGVDYDLIERENNKDREMGGDELIFEGTTWPHSICSPICCNSIHWRITGKRIDYEHGYCQNHADTVDMRRIKDLAFRRNPLQLLLGRGTIIIYSDAQSNDSVVEISRMGARRIYLKLRQVWTNIKSGVTM